jgi:hypothetical protein
MHSKRMLNDPVRSHIISGLHLNHVTIQLLFTRLYHSVLPIANDHTFLETSVQVPTPSAISVMEELTTDTNDVPLFNFM